MRVHLTEAGAITLVEPQVFNRLDILADVQSSQQLERAIARIGCRADERHIWVEPSILRFLSGYAGDGDWEKHFTGMLTYAQVKGWLDEQGRVRAHLVDAPQSVHVAEADFKAALRALPAGVSVVTTGGGESAAGMVVSSLTSVSAQPPLVGFFVHRASSMHGTLLTNGMFAANVLGAQHGGVMTAFLSGRQGPARFAAGKWLAGETGLPVLGDALASLECEIVFTHSLGTHDLVVGKVLRTACRPADPLVHFNGATHSLETQPQALAA